MNLRGKPLYPVDLWQYELRPLCAKQFVLGQSGCLGCYTSHRSLSMRKFQLSVIVEMVKVFQNQD